MADVKHKQNFGKLIADLKRQIDEVRKRVGLTSATISSGGLTVQNAGGITVADGGGITIAGGGGITVKDDGTITVVADDGTEIVINPPGAVGPTLRWIPSLNPDNFSQIRSAIATDGQAEIVIDSGFTSATTQTVTQFTATGQEMGMFTYVYPSGAAAGGAVIVEPDAAELAIFNASGNAGGFIAAAPTSAEVGCVGASADVYWFLNGATGITNHWGKWENFLDDGAGQGLYTGQSAAGSAGDLFFALTYGATRASAMTPIATLFDTSVHPTTVTAASTAGFTLTWTTASHANYRILFWVFRV